jgi:hypothetical protein
MICRACKKHPVPVDERRRRREGEDPKLAADLADVRRLSEDLCNGCAIAASLARLDQGIARFEEKSRLGQCIVRECEEPRIHGDPSERCVGHRAMLDRVLEGD